VKKKEEENIVGFFLLCIRKATVEVLHSFEMPRHKGNRLIDEHLKFSKGQEVYNSHIERTKFYLTF
jgi:hypothetical protein